MGLIFVHIQKKNKMKFPLFAQFKRKKCDKKEKDLNESTFECVMCVFVAIHTMISVANNNSELNANTNTMKCTHPKLPQISNKHNQTNTTTPLHSLECSE